ncbi:hypothetical protein EIP86_010872 [Pleurotus ostreatoroseus]|nr:hypothetical protein EIP86_010872 [Pleurotus ostreatoroseus]
MLFRGRGRGSEREGQSDRQVNNLLNTLRGEQFRHAQNVRSKQDRTGRRPIVFDYHQPSLPLSQLFGISDVPADEDIAPIQPAPFRNPGQIGHAGTLARPPVTLVEGVPTYDYPNGAVPGPRPPRSWSSLFQSEKDIERETAWRTHALSLFISHGPLPPSYASISHDALAQVQPLTLTCLRVLLAACEDVKDLAAVMSYVPAQLRRELMRWCAVHSPLDTARLRILCMGDGHAAGELIVVGPEAILRTDFLTSVRDRSTSHAHSPSPADEHHQGEEEREEDWDGLHTVDTPLSLTALAVMSALVSTSTLLSLPRTLTRLALLSLSQRLPIHNLTRTCPYLEVLDLSFNPWLKSEDNAPGSSALEFSSLNRVEWRRWRNLRVLGLRDCGLGMDIIARVNEGR